MKKIPLFLPLLLLLTTLHAQTSQPTTNAAYSPTANPVPVKTLEATWHYATPVPATETDREVPIKIYYPADLATRTAPCPLIIFSHGLGGNRESYPQWGNDWAAAGYVVLLPQHHGSDTLIIKDGIAGLRNAMTPEQVLLRDDDVHFVIDQMEKANAGLLPNDNLPLFKNKLDVTHVGMAGHSYGALTTNFIAGQYSMDNSPLRPEPRVAAAIAMSPQPAYGVDQAKSFATIHIPMLYFTGTADKTQLNTPGVKDLPGNTTPEDRTIPFQFSVDPRTYLCIFNGATHMSFAAPEHPPADASTATTLRAAILTSLGRINNSPPIHPYVQSASIAFWDAYLKNNAAAKNWLEQDFPKQLGKAGKFEQK